jgi:N,N'-diacetyllegionaminate synthase
MSNMGDIEAAIDVIERAGTARDSITVLQCTTEYPAPFGEVNLRAIQTIRDTFKVSVGFSDHTEGLEAAIAAVALGATVVEKHITLDRALPGPDHRASIEPAQLEQLVRSIRNVELAMGDGIKRPTQSEDKNRLVARRSLVAARPIVRGEPYTEHNVAAKRPGIGISPMRLDEVMGRPAPRDFATDEAIEI